MPHLQDVVRALRQYRDRYQYFDSFADDIEEIRTREIETMSTLVEMTPRPLLAVRVGDESLIFEPHPAKGLVRFWLDESADPKTDLLDGVNVKAMITALLESAGKVKQGLLGGYAFAILVGGSFGPPVPVERVRAMEFDPISNDWRIYFGPLLRWAKRTIDPAAA